MDCGIRSNFVIIRLEAVEVEDGNYSKVCVFEEVCRFCKVKGLKTAIVDAIKVEGTMATVSMKVRQRRG